MISQAIARSHSLTLETHLRPLRHGSSNRRPFAAVEPWLPERGNLRYMRILSFAALAVLAVTMSPGATGNRRATENKLSPSADTSVTLGGHAITVEYNAPSARGRKVEGGLVPYDSVWRLGADNATTLTTDADIKIGDLAVPKGAYTLYILASESGWKLAVNKQTGQWGTEYNESQDLGRVPMKVSKLSPVVETLKITLRKNGESAALLEIAWGRTLAVVPVKMDTKYL
jgi:hypothetical protein